MKIAICGNGPHALSAAAHFNNLGAAVTLFAGSENLAGHGAVIHSTSDSLEQLIEQLHKTVLVRPAAAKRVHKRYLALDEVIPERTRLHDLFRVVFDLDPEQEIQYQKENNPEVFSQLDEAVLKSLKKTIENYDDFDIVIDAREKYEFPCPMGPSNSWALNEEEFTEDINYGIKDFLHSKDKILAAKNLLLVGTGQTACFFLAQLKDWLSNEQNHLFIVTNESFPFQKLLEDEHTHTHERQFIHDFLEERKKRWDAQVEEFELKLRSWRNLESYEQAKIPRPSEPSPQVQILKSSNVMAIDRLSDREGLFITIESPSFRGSEESLRVINVDHALVATGYEKTDHLTKGLLDNEPGFYSMPDLNLEQIERDIMQYFSKRDSQ